MACQTFRYFPFLPKELRDHIWNLAVQSTPGGAHFFTIFNRGIDPSSALAEHAVSFNFPDQYELAQYGFITTNRYDLEGVYPNGYGLAAPRCTATQELSWVGSNRSAYLRDAGLWAACTESRLLMEKQFKPTKWSALCYAHGLEDDPGWALVKYALNGESRSFSVNPNADLFCLQPFNPDNITWPEISTNMHIFALQIGHLAIEYDPLRGIDGKGPYSVHTMEAFAYIAYSTPDSYGLAKKMWVIDNRLRRRPGECHVEGYRQEFHGNGCRFVEVQMGDDELIWEIESGDSIFDFIRNLDQLYYWHGGAPSDRLGPKFGVLACEI